MNDNTLLIILIFIIIGFILSLITYAKKRYFISSIFLIFIISICLSFIPEYAYYNGQKDALMGKYKYKMVIHNKLIDSVSINTDTTFTKIK